jgi:hypothetical protein
MIDSEKLRALLNGASGRPWKCEASWNNAGMPLADFTIPGHNQGATVEMLLADAELIVEAINSLPQLLEIFELAVKFKMTHVENPQQLDDVDRAMQLGKMMGAKEQLIIAIDNALAGEESDGEEDEEEE